MVPAQLVPRLMGVVERRGQVIPWRGGFLRQEEEAQAAPTPTPKVARERVSQNGRPGRWLWSFPLVTLSLGLSQWWCLTVRFGRGSRTLQRQDWQGRALSQWPRWGGGKTGRRKELQELQGPRPGWVSSREAGASKDNRRSHRKNVEPWEEGK